MNLTQEQMAVLRDSEEFASLRTHPGFVKLVTLAQEEVLKAWSALLEIAPEELARKQGWIEGANFVLEYADAKVVQAELVRQHAQADQRAALESQFAAQAQQSSRPKRRMVTGATLD